ncbi:ABC transporter, ATP-binding protein [Peptostreptococcaceae bacterium oral taxon 113 str. W5053]|nr:ABC transporter, ATP-binding protein [Peptostreptococcaceae bacterium oral taxon 113 str. W5053]
MGVAVLIELKNYSFSYDGKKQILNNINLKIKQGEFVAVTGLSGCGKTTLTRVLNGLCPNFYQGEAEGDYRLYDSDAKNMSISELSRYWGSVFQDPRSQFLAKRVRDELVIAMENACEDRFVMQERLKKTADSLDIENLLDREMMFLSSGEKQKVAIGSVFCTYPKGFVLDEPSANLDNAATRGLADFLKQVKEKGHTVVISEHRLHYLVDLMDRLIIMKDGFIIEDLSRDEIKSLCDSKLKKLGLRRFNTPELNITGNVNGESTFLACKGVSCVKGSYLILDDVDLNFESGKVHVIVGENGAGKSSICKIITGLYKQTTGNVYIDGLLVKRKERLKRTFFVGQDVDYQLYGYSIKNEFQIGNRSLDDKKIEDCLDEINLKVSLDTNPQVLSGGQKQRLLIGIAYLSDRDIIVLDEPTSGLDAFHMRIVSDLVKYLSSKGKTVIIITHDQEFTWEVADTVLYIRNGKVQYHKNITKEI